MLASLKQALVTPASTDAEKTRVAELLRAILLIGLILCVVVTPVNALLPGPANRIAVQGIFILGLACLLLILKRGHVMLSARLFVIGCWLFATFFLYYMGGMHGNGPLLYLLFLVAAGLLFSFRAGIVFSIPTVAACAWAFYAEQHGLLPNRLAPESVSVETVLILAAALFLTLYLISFSNGNLRHALARLSQDEERLRVANRRALESEARWKALVQSVPAGIALVDRDGRAEFVNTGLAGIEHTSGKPLVDLMPEAFHDLATQTMHQVIETGKPASFEAFIRDNHNHLISTSIAVGPVVLGDGPHDRLIFVFTDSTERRQLVDRERAVSRNMQAVIEAADELIAITEPEAFLRRAVELAREKLRLERCGLFLPEPGGQWFRGTFGTDGAGKTTDERTARFPITDHPEIFVRMETPWLVREKPLTFWADGQTNVVGTGWEATTMIRTGTEPIGVFSNDTAITHQPIDPLQQEALALYCSLLGNILKRRNAEEALRESESRYRKTIELMSDYAFAYDVHPDGRFTSHWITEASYYRLTGYDWREVGNTFVVYHPDDAGAAQRDVQRTIQGETTQGEYRIITRSGEVRWLYIRRQPERDPASNRVVRYYGVAQDVTDRKLAESEIRELNAELERRVKLRTEELEDANRELEAFAYSVSHDLRAPLRSINGFSRTLNEQYKALLDEKAQNYLSRIDAASRRMGEMIDGLLMLSRIARSELRIERVDLSHLAAEIVAGLRESAPERSVAVTIAPGLCANGDERLLRVILQNLLENAWKYSGKQADARIEFGCVEPESEVASTFFVRDNGVGFDMAYVTNLFGPFQRLHTEAEFPGTGIGLATVRRAIGRHGGKIWVEAQTDQGATFFFSL